MKTLMHICCAPCANRPIAALREEGIELAGFWYNPNIHPLYRVPQPKNLPGGLRQGDLPPTGGSQ